MSVTQLPPGNGRDRMRLFDRQWRPLWDSAVDTAPAYRHISTEVHAVIDHPDGTRWTGMFYRCPEGVKRWTRDDLRWFRWPEIPLVGTEPKGEK